MTNPSIKLATEFKEDNIPPFTITAPERLTVGRLLEELKDQSPDTPVALVDWDHAELDYLHHIEVRKVICFPKTEQEYILTRDQESDHPEYLRRQVEAGVEPIPYPVVVLG